MASTDVMIVNRGLSKIASSRVSVIRPPKTNLEGFIANNYDAWKRTELTKRRWVFALEDNYTLTLDSVLTGVEKKYKYRLPNDCLRPVRRKRDEWVQRGRYLFSCSATLTINYIKDAPEADFDPLFEEVLACKVAVESCEYVTQSNTKKQWAQGQYDEAIQIAGQANAFVIGQENATPDDDQFSWLVGHNG